YMIYITLSIVAYPDPKDYPIFIIPRPVVEELTKVEGEDLAIVHPHAGKPYFETEQVGPLEAYAVIPNAATVIPYAHPTSPLGGVQGDGEIGVLPVPDVPLDSQTEEDVDALNGQCQ
ncbi:hypothetical protein L0F63_006467, partial [Massospora cicadina]